ILLLEMLSGQRAFEGETITETLAAIMKDPIPLDRVPPGTPAPLRALLARCLERDPKRRLQAIGEARIALEEMRGASTTGMSGIHLAVPGKRTGAALLPWAVAGVCLALAAIAWLRPPGGARSETGGSVRKFLVETGRVADVDRRPAILSPDG